jgi:hypothetical protein
MSRQTQLKIKIINLADEQRTIRKEVHKFGRQISAITLENGEDDSSLWKLRAQQGDIFWHGYNTVREAAREAQLAYGFLRGTAYERIEQKTNDVPDWACVRSTAKRFYEGENFPEEWEAWQTAADEFLAGYMLAA